MNEEQIQQLRNLLDEGREIKYEYYPILAGGVEDHFDSRKAQHFAIWEKKVKAFGATNLVNNPLYDDLIKSIDGNSLYSNSDSICNILQAILESL